MTPLLAAALKVRNRTSKSDPLYRERCALVARLTLEVIFG